MSMFAGHRNAAAATLSALPSCLLAACAALLSGCSPDQPPATSPGTTPPVWTGSPAPEASAAGNAALAAQSIITVLKNADGAEIATAKFDFGNGFATVTIATTGPGHLAPGFHGVHIHKVGKCEPNSVAPDGGEPGDFLSAGGHFQVPGRSAEPDSGYLPSLQVRQDGTGMLATTTDAFGMDDLLTGQKTAIIIHAGADNFANIPPDRYRQLNGAPGADQTTRSTGDAGKRVACGVIGSG